MIIHLRFFASLREALNLSQEILNVPDSITTVGELRIFLCKRSSIWAEALADSLILRMALNQELVSADAALQDGSEVAFFPPVTGG